MKYSVKVWFSSFIAAALVALSPVLSGCGSANRLSEELQGVWGSAPESLDDTGAEEATLTRMWEFTTSPTNNAAEGTLNITALITVENIMPMGDSIAAPLQITASGTASITGAYQAVDGNRVALQLDMSSLAVRVTPDAVRLTLPASDQQQEALRDKLRPGATVLARQQIIHAARHLFGGFDQIDNIKISGPVMNCRVKGKTDLTFRRQQ